MTAYIIVVEEDDQCFEEERLSMIGWIKDHGGKLLVRSAPNHIIEGDLDIRRVVLVEYDSVEDAKAAFETEEYAAVRNARTNAGFFASVVIAEGK